MRSLQTVSTLGQGESVFTSVPDDGAAFSFGTRKDVSDGTRLLTLHENEQERFGVFADGSLLSAVLADAVAAPEEEQWWFEDDGGTVRLRMYINGSIQDVAGGAGGSGTITEVVAGDGLTGGGDIGSVTVDVDYAQVAAAVHAHDDDYLRRDGGNTMTGRLQSLDGTAAAPGITGTTDADSGLFFGSGFVGLSVDGSPLLQATATALIVNGNYQLPVGAPVSGQALIAGAGGVVGWSGMAHSSMTGIGANDHHDQLHAIAGGDHTATAWRVFYSDDLGNIVELPLGGSGEVLTAQGASSAPQWAAAALKPSLADAPTVGYNFTDAADTGLGANATSLFLHLAGAQVLNLSPTGGATILGQYTLPATAGVAGQSLVNQGSGIVSWGSIQHSQLGDMTEDDHHPRTHSLDSEVDHLASPWRVFFSNDEGHVKELALGDNGQALISNGPAADPSFQDVATEGGADVGGPYTRFFMFGSI